VERAARKVDPDSLPKTPNFPIVKRKTGARSKLEGGFFHEPAKPGEASITEGGVPGTQGRLEVEEPLGGPTRKCLSGELLNLYTTSQAEICRPLGVLDALQGGGKNTGLSPSGHAERGIALKERQNRFQLQPHQSTTDWWSTGNHHSDRWS